MLTGLRSGRPILNLYNIGGPKAKHIFLDEHDIPATLITVWYHPGYDFILVKNGECMVTVLDDDLEHLIDLPGYNCVPEKLVYLGVL